MKKLFYWHWILYGYIGRNRVFDKYVGAGALFILTCYNLERMKNIEPIVRSILKCTFIEKIIVSNHNPSVILEHWVRIKDKRLKLVNQMTRRGPGSRWKLAHEEGSEFIILIDDDMLVYPSQLEILFNHLVKQPDIPHGITGHYKSEYYQNKEMEVGTLNQIYAITRQHLVKYFELSEAIKAIDYMAYEDIEFYADDILISKSGINKPRIHNVGTLLRCPTARKPGVAMHLEENFLKKRIRVIDVLELVMQH